MNKLLFIWTTKLVGVFIAISPVFLSRLFVSEFDFYYYTSYILALSMGFVYYSSVYKPQKHMGFHVFVVVYSIAMVIIHSVLTSFIDNSVSIFNREFLLFAVGALFVVINSLAFLKFLHQIDIKMIKYERLVTLLAFGSVLMVLYSHLIGTF